MIHGFIYALFHLNLTKFIQLSNDSYSELCCCYFIWFFSLSIVSNKSDLSLCIRYLKLIQTLAESNHSREISLFMRTVSILSYLLHSLYCNYMYGCIESYKRPKKSNGRHNLCMNTNKRLNCGRTKQCSVDFTFRYDPWKRAQIIGNTKSALSETLHTIRSITTPCCNWGEKFWRNALHKILMTL